MFSICRPLSQGKVSSLLVALEVVLHVALRAHVGPHLLPRRLGEINPSRSHRVLERGPADPQVHRLWVVTIAARRTHMELSFELLVRRGVERFPAHRLDQQRRLGRVAVGARAGLLRDFLTLRLLLVDQRVVVAAVLVEIDAERVAGPHPRQDGISRQLVDRIGAAVRRRNAVDLGLLEGVVLAGVVLPPDRRIELLVAHRCDRDRRDRFFILVRLDTREHGGDAAP